MYNAPTGPVDTLQKALRKDLQNIPLPEPSLETAQRMAQILREIADAMRAVDADNSSSNGFLASRRDDSGVYWRRCS